MRKITALCAAAVALGVLLAQAPAGAQAPAAEKPKYVGVESCGMCHKSAAKGNQLGQWQGSKHAQAYATLATPKAKEIATAKGIADPQKADQCLKCHVTAHGVDASLIQAAAEGKKGYKVEDGVGCESCHGPGSQYKAMAVMKDKAQAAAKGLVEPNEALCKKCHNAESPTAKPFVYADMVKKIAHPNPAAK
jgi:hypothetical protein